jgi:hypothetical protein
LKVNKKARRGLNMSLNRLVFALVWILVLIAPGAYAMDLRLSGCGSNGKFSEGTSFHAAKEGDVFAYSTIDSGSLTQDCIAHGIRKLDKHYIVDNMKGEHAEINVNVRDARFLSYDKPDRAETDTSASLSEFSLSAIDAKEIKCGAAASNRFEDQASVGIEINEGSLIDYRASAIAQVSDSDHSTLASQQIGSSEGEKIILNAEASDKHAIHEAEAITEVIGEPIKGYKHNIKNYNSEAYCGKTISDLYPDLYAIHGAFTLDSHGDYNSDLAGYISGRIITSKGTAIDQSGLKAGYRTTISDGAINGFFSQGTQARNNKVIAISLEAPANWEDWQGPPYSEMKDNIVIAKQIKFRSSASDGSGEESSQNIIGVPFKRFDKVFIKNWLGSGSFAYPDEADSQKDCGVPFNGKLIITP